MVICEPQSKRLASKTAAKDQDVELKHGNDGAGRATVRKGMRKYSTWPSQGIPCGRDK
ncbi:hypothetical protein GCM10025771_39010 [Niveibacterium umoris]